MRVKEEANTITLFLLATWILGLNNMRMWCVESRRKHRLNFLDVEILDTGECKLLSQRNMEILLGQWKILCPAR